MCTWIQTQSLNQVSSFLNLKKCAEIKLKSINIGKAHPNQQIENFQNIIKHQNQDRRSSLKGKIIKH
jgi:hypothetical protein